jgi:hypothetical protein
MTSRRAHPAVTFFGTLISKSFSLFVSSIKSIFSLSGQGSFFVCRFTFSFLSVSLSVSLSVFVCFFRGFHFESFLCRVLVPAISSFFRVAILDSGVVKKIHRERKLEDSVGDRRAGGQPSGPSKSPKIYRTATVTVLPWSRNPSSSSEIEVIILH